MNKTLFLALFLSFFYFSACKNDSNKTVATEEKEPAVMALVAEDVVAEVPTDSEIDFDMAYEAFSEEDNTLAIEYIESAIEDLRAESEDLDDEAKAKVEMSIAALKELIAEIANEKVKDVASLQDAFSDAEMTIAHDYLVFSGEYLIDEPEDCKNSLELAIEKMENASKNMEGAAKVEAAEMIVQSKSLLQRFDKKTDKWGNALDGQIDNMERWLKKHVKTPATDENE